MPPFNDERGPFGFVHALRSYALPEADQDGTGRISGSVVRQQDTTLVSISAPRAGIWAVRVRYRGSAGGSRADLRNNLPRITKIVFSRLELSLTERERWGAGRYGFERNGSASLTRQPGQVGFVRAPIDPVEEQHPCRRQAESNPKW
jgi:hypothetical protein